MKINIFLQSDSQIEPLSHADVAPVSGSSNLPEPVYFERVQLSSLAVSLESLLPDFLECSSTRQYSSSISPIDGVRVPSCRSSETVSSSAGVRLFGVWPLLAELIGGGLGCVLGGFPRSVGR